MEGGRIASVVGSFVTPAKAGVRCGFQLLPE